MAFIIIIASLIIAAVILSIDFNKRKQKKPIQTQKELVVACLDAPLHEFGLWQDVMGESIWVGYENGGFDLPDKRYFLSDVLFKTSKGERYMWIVASHSIPDTIYVFPFKSMEPYADANGDHYGVHPCGAYRVTDYPSWLVDNA